MLNTRSHRSPATRRFARADVPDPVDLISQGAKGFLDGVNRGGLVELGGLLLRVSFLEIVRPKIIVIPTRVMGSPSSFEFKRLLKTACLRRFPRPSSLRRTPKYASVLGSRGPSIQAFLNSLNHGTGYIL